MNKAISPSVILDTVYGFRQARVILTAFELGIFTCLGTQSKTASEIGAALHTDERATDRLMDALCAMGLLKKKNERFSNTPLAARFLVEGKPEYMAGLMHSANLWKTWSTLTDVVRAGSSVATRAGEQYVEVNWVEAFIAAMHMRAYKTAPKVIKLLDLRGVRRVLDLGGGSGAYSMAFARAKRDIQVVVFDLPSVTPLTRKYLAATNLTERILIVDGDYTVDSLGHGFDLVFLSAIIHSNAVDINRMLVKKSFNALNPNGQLVIQDHIMDEDRTAPLAGALFSLNMLVGTKAGDTFTESEIRGWITEAGFKKIQQKNNPFGPGLIIGKKVSVQP
jgi:ubiquinone/menaquinone biosynthesis C-methylase UbiE